MGEKPIKAKTILGFTTSDPDQIEGLMAIKTKYKLNNPKRDMAANALIGLGAAAALLSGAGNANEVGFIDRTDEQRKAKQEAIKYMKERWGVYPDRKGNNLTQPKPAESYANNKVTPPKGYNPPQPGSNNKVTPDPEENNLPQPKSPAPAKEEGPKTWLDSFREAVDAHFEEAADKKAAEEAKDEQRARDAQDEGISGLLKDWALGKAFRATPMGAAWYLLTRNKEKPANPNEHRHVARASEPGYRPTPKEQEAAAEYLAVTMGAKPEYRAVTIQANLQNRPTLTISNRKQTTSGPTMGKPETKHARIQ